MSAQPVIRILGGIFFILAGIFAYYRFAIGLALPFLFVGAGAAVLLVAIAGHRASGGDIAIFVIGLLVLGSVASGLTIGRTQTVTYSATKNQVNAHQMLLKASTNFSSIDIGFSNRKGLAYQVNFTGSIPFLPVSMGQPFFSNRTINGVLLLEARSSGDAIAITLGEGYFTNITATTGAGSINLNTLGGEHLGRISLSTGAGSVSAMLNVASIRELDMNTGSGSVSLNSNRLIPESPRVPISLSSGAGSVSMNISVPRDAGVTISASTGIGTISQNLPGFSVTSSPGRLNARAGDLSDSNPSFEISLSTGAGTLSLESRLI